MKHFTKEQIEEIRIQLATKAVRDSDFDETFSIQDEDFVPILQGEKNKRISAGNMFGPINEEINGMKATFVTRLVDDLINYYTKEELYSKDESYSKEEIDELIRATQNFHYEVYANRNLVRNPSPNVLYLIGPVLTPEGSEIDDLYQEWVYWHSTWTLIGTTGIELSTKQDKLVSGENIKTVNDQSIVGSGNLEVGDLNAVKFIQQTLTSEQKEQSRTNIGAGTYSLPSGGVPKTDLAQAVQASLDAADSAYQKPNIGIPKTDLASGVQSSLDLADSSVQAEPIGGEAVQLTHNSQQVYPVTDVSLITGLEERSGMRVIPYTTLPTASAETAGFIYMDESTKDLYITKATSGSYSWVSAGNLSNINLDNYATKDEVSQLGQEVNGLNNVVDLDSYTQYQGKIINSTGGWASSGKSKIIFIPITGVKSIRFQTTTTAAIVALLKSDTIGSGRADFATGESNRMALDTNSDNIIDVPTDANYLYVVTCGSDEVDRRPTYTVTLTAPGITDEIAELSSAVVSLEDNVTGLITESPKKYLTASGASYQVHPHKGVVKLDVVTYYDNLTDSVVTLYADGDASSHQEKSFTLDGNARFLVIDTNTNTIKTRSTQSAVIASDIVLLNYNTSIYQFVGGALYADYAAKDRMPLVVYSSSCDYSDGGTSITVTIDTVTFYDSSLDETTTIYADGNASSHSPKAFTLNSAARVLVIDADGAIATRVNSVSAIKGDIVLLIYNTTSYKIVGGLLFQDYLAHKVSSASSLNGYVREDVFADAPEYYLWLKAEQFTKIKWTPLKATIQKASSTDNFPASEQVGIPYSSVAEYDKRIGTDVSLHTFMTALHNPYSLIYTECVRYGYSRSAYGRQYYGPPNSGPFYGVVCSNFVSYAQGTIPYITSDLARLAESGLMSVVYDQSANGVRRGDIIWQTGHVMLVKNVWRKNGVVTQVLVSQEAQPKAGDMSIMTAAAFNTWLGQSGRILYRYNDLYKNITYEPSPYVAVGDETPQAVTYNDDICTFAGDKASFAEGELIYIHALNLDYPQMEIYKDDALIDTITLGSDSRAAKTSDNLAYAVNLSNDGLTYGKYKCRLKNGDTYSEFTYFEIINASVTLSGNIATYSSANGKAVYWYWSEYHSADGNGMYNTSPLTGLASGAIDVSERREGYNLLKVLFRGEYGNVAAVFLVS